MISASRLRRHSFILLSIVVALVLLRAALPYMVRDYVDRQLNSHPGYSGHVERVHLALWRGAYEIHGMEIRQLDSDSKEPLFQTDKMEISLLWSGLVKGQIQARIRVFEPKVNFAPAHAGSAAQTGMGPDWVATLKALAPAGIDRFETVDGQVHYSAPYKDPPVDLSLDHVDAVLTNLGNHGIQADSTVAPTRVAKLQMHALAAGQAEVSADLDFAPHEKAPDFHLRLRLIQLQVQRMRDFLRAYTLVDPKSGTLDVVAELDAKDGGVKGYIKPLFHDLELIRADQLKEEKDPVHFVVDAIGSVLNLMFQNQRKDQLATVIPIEGRIDAPGVDVSATIGNLIENAVVKAFQPTFESKDGDKKDSKDAAKDGDSKK